MWTRIRIGLTRQLGSWYVRSRWRNAIAQDLATADHGITVDGENIGVRVYTPRGAGPFPVLVFYHGGGWIGGSVETHDPLCRELCSITRHLVVSVDYRLAPEHPFPAAPIDCIVALQWVLDNLESLNGHKERIVLCGDSAGGNLAAVVAIHARERWPGAIKGQILIYPVTDHYSTGTASYRTFGKGHGLTAQSMIWMWDLYLAGRPVDDVATRRLATPLRAEDLHALPPAFILHAAADPLRDEALAYADALRQQGVAVRDQTYAGTEHGFVGMNGPTPEHRAALADIRDWLRESVAARSAGPGARMPL